jgi:hypothetical protein
MFKRKLKQPKIAIESKISHRIEVRSEVPIGKNYGNVEVINISLDQYKGSTLDLYLSVRGGYNDRTMLVGFEDLAHCEKFAEILMEMCYAAEAAAEKEFV